MGQALEPIVNLFRFHKLKMLVVLLFAVVFSLWIFPSGDLSDIVSDQATRGSGMYIQLEGLSLAFNPGPGIHAENLVIEPPDMPAIDAASAEVYPSIIDAILGKTAAAAYLSGLFKGDVSVDVSEGDKMKSGERVKNLTLVTERLDLSRVGDYMRDANMMNLELKGAMNLNTTMSIDPAFTNQPSGTAAVDIANFSLPAQTLQTQMGPIQTPPLALGKLSVQAKMNDGQLELQEVNFGGAKDGLSGKVKGQIVMNMRRVGAVVSPVIGNYKLGIDLTIPKSFMTSNPMIGGLLDGMVGKFKKETANEVRYTFAAQGVPGGVPIFTDKL